jgi:hypothetical protein
MGAKPRKKITGLAGRILKENGPKKRKKYTRRKKRAVLKNCKLGKITLPLYMLPQISDTGLFAMGYDTTKRGKLLRVGTGSAYVEMEIIIIDIDEDGKKQTNSKIDKFHISKETMVRALIQ